MEWIAAYSTLFSIKKEPRQADFSSVVNKYYLRMDFSRENIFNYQNKFDESHSV